MGRFVRGDVVVLPFPFSDLSSAKRRPALVVASLMGDDLILCAISSQSKGSDLYTVALSAADFAGGSLSRDSYIRCDHLFTADSSIVEYKVGTLVPAKLDEVIKRLVAILSGQVM